MMVLVNILLMVLLISDCDDFVAGPNANWTHVLVATTVADGAASQELKLLL